MSKSGPGITFRETMKGGFALGMTDPEAGAGTGRRASTELAMHATITIDDMERFIADPERGGHITGAIDFPPLGMGIPAERGVFNLFTPADAPHTKHMIYELAFEVNGKPHYLAGRKIVRNDRGFDLWSDTTTLFTTLHEGSDRTGEVIGAGVLGLTTSALIRLLTTVRAINTSSAADRARVITQFGSFFSRELFDSYVRTAPGSRSPDAPGPASATDRWDVVVVGSGFGGAVAACRLAEAGMRVLVLERGRRWDPQNLPRRADDDGWWWDHRRPERRNGWIDLRLFRRVGVAQGAAVGGGSHIYANISVEAPPLVFEQGWPEGVDYSALAPHYDRVGEFMEITPVPDNQIPERTRLMQEAANAVGAGERFRKIGLAVRFDPDSAWDGREQLERSRSKTVTNRHGVAQGTCYHCGRCDIGCDVQAKNTLDLNYLAVAERHGCEIHPLHLVSHLDVQDKGYAVHFERLEDGRRVPGVVYAERVVLAAGSLGSTELLLRCRDQYRTLQRLSPRLGQGWSTNGDFLTPAFYQDREPLPSRGPTITSAIDFLDGQRSGHRFWIQDGGVPDLLDAWLEHYVDRRPRNPLDWRMQRWVKQRLQGHAPLRRMMPWFAQGVDHPDGEFNLRRRWGLFGRQELRLDWDVTSTAPLIDEIAATHKALAEATGGRPAVPASWTHARYLVTPHPLGGCAMADSAEQGVVARNGEVFGHPQLYVIDGAMFPSPIGVNPSRTIAALAEFCTEQIIAEERVPG
jgi:cholesterol oxidase